MIKDFKIFTLTRRAIKAALGCIIIPLLRVAAFLEKRRDWVCVLTTGALYAFYREKLIQINACLDRARCVH